MLSMARKPALPPKVSRITVPQVCHPAVKVVFAEMQRQGVTYDELEFRSGVLKSTFKAWRTNNRPGLETMEAALGALGWAFLPVPSLKRVPTKIRAELERLAQEWGDEERLLLALLAGVARNAAIEARKYRVTEKSKKNNPTKKSKVTDPTESAEKEAARKAKTRAYIRQWHAKRKLSETPEEAEHRRAKERYKRALV